MKLAEMEPAMWLWLCEAPVCAKKGPRAALNLMVRINGEATCPDCLKEYERRTR
jgi:hypothetical protein